MTDTLSSAEFPEPHPASDIATHTMAVTFFKDKKALRLRVEDLTLQGISIRIAAETAATKATLPLLELKTFGNLRTDKNCLRHDANVVSFGGIEGDADDQRLSYDQAVARVREANVRALVYTSPSWVEGVIEKWRVLLPLSQDYPPERRAEFLAWANGLFDGAFSGETFTLSQAYYYGHVGGQPYKIEIVDGDFLDLRPDLAAGAIGKPGKAAKTNGTAGTAEGVGSAGWDHHVANIIAGAPLHTSLLALAAMLVTAGTGGGAAVNLLRGLMMSSKARVDDPARWQDRFDAIPDFVRTAEDKFGPPVPEVTVMNGVVLDGSDHDPETGEVFEDDEVKLPKLADIPLPNIDWTRPYGLLGEMTEHVLATSQFPNRPLAVASALATLSPVCGRWLYGPTGSSLGLYIVILARTTVGKDDPLSAVERILRAAGLDRLHTTGKAFSISALEQMIASHPSVVATCDEIGASLFNRMSNKNANSHAQDMKGALLELWTRNQSKGPFSNTRRALQEGLKAKAIIIVERPNLTLFGVSGPKRFWESIPPGSIQDGFLNRFLTFSAAPRGAPQEVSEEATVVPQSIVDGLQKLVPMLGGNVADALSVYDPRVKGDTLERAVHRLEWEDDTVKARAHEFQRQVLHVQDNNPDEADLVGRVYEYAIRLASLHAVSCRGGWADVRMLDLEWGIVASVTAALTLISGAGRLSNTDYEARFNLIRHVIEDAGEIGQREILRKVRSINEQQRNEVTKHLREGGWIKAVKITTKGRTADGWGWIGGD